MGEVFILKGFIDNNSIHKRFQTEHDIQSSRREIEQSLSHVASRRGDEMYRNDTL